MRSLFWEHEKLNVSISRIKKTRNLCILLPEKEKENDCLIKQSHLLCNEMKKFDPK